MTASKGPLLLLTPSLLPLADTLAVALAETMTESESDARMSAKVSVLARVASAASKDSLLAVTST